MHKTREEWLQAFAAHPITRAAFEEAGAELPRNVRVSIGFSSKGAKSNTIGQCWSDVCSEDGHFEIFIVPGLAEAARVADVLTHELVHAAVGLQAKHGPAFRKVATKLGLEGKMTATVAGDGWREWAEPVLEAIGPFPHAALNTAGGETSAPKVQKNRQIKVVCGECGFTFRAARKWLDRELRCPDLECDGLCTVEEGDDA